MTVIPTTYSPIAVARSFKMADTFELPGRILLVIYNGQTPRATVVEADIEIFNNTPRHQVLATPDLQHKPYLDNDILTVERCWEEASAFWIEGIYVNPSEQDKGLATRLCEVLISRCDVTLISDFKQYDGGKILWQKIVCEPEYISASILDTEQDAF